MEQQEQPNKKEEIIIKAFVDGKEVELDKIKITIEFDGNLAETDVQTSILRNMTLLQENVIFRMALEELREKTFGPREKKTPGGIVLPE